jgi:hypothetical protein
VIFSSHIMQEVAALCDRIVVIARASVRGRHADELRAQTGETTSRTPSSSDRLGGGPARMSAYPTDDFDDDGGAQGTARPVPRPPHGDARLLMMPMLFPAMILGMAAWPRARRGPSSSRQLACR